MSDGFSLANDRGEVSIRIRNHGPWFHLIRCRRSGRCSRDKSFDCRRRLFHGLRLWRREHGTPALETELRRISENPAIEDLIPHAALQNPFSHRTTQFVFRVEGLTRQLSVEIVHSVAHAFAPMRRVPQESSQERRNLPRCLSCSPPPHIWFPCYS
jgi:hypothetical protein